MWYNKGSLLREAPFFVFMLKEKMNEEKIKNNVEAAMNAEEFNVLDYLEDQPVGEDSVVVYTNVAKARELHKLLQQRAVIIAERERDVAKEDYDNYSIADELKDTELDPEINEIVEELERTALTFTLRTVAPKLIRAIEKHAEAVADKEWSYKEQEQHQLKTTADILSRAIVSVRRGDGAVDNSEWNAEKLLKMEESLYQEQGRVLIGALQDIVYTGQVFEDALTVDFS